MGRIIALDYGTKRIGIALSDETKTISFPRPYIPASEKRKLLTFIHENEVEKILLGLPKALSGKDTESTTKTRSFMVWLETETHLPVEFIDERLTTKEAMKLETDRELIDSLVAQKMLERYLDKISN
ncbi:MAG: hypothetical protein A2846_00360 [Candidatus Doudnabacteria bacterium RIFCSPHIGHO2_01_FULL_49_9]|uniref:Putative pre-16S rRNA nuclease n=1 Tax=Candidatus Doudnabacteria bacterium RIFCSPHIGHO2_01_FULL_49_9 TaxID=1817827 RepID=A0A1F5NY36_9BACT|nr:MAG: hypothetical protein A2846_00360 [Candidatus Doudnabacteria bacterium RIFCSPHIGHO2_01_FULL_49_9]